MSVTFPPIGAPRQDGSATAVKGPRTARGRSAICTIPPAPSATRSAAVSAVMVVQLAARSGIASWYDCGGLDHQDHAPFGRARAMHHSLRHSETLIGQQLD
jgi:hypothetical protein